MNFATFASKLDVKIIEASTVSSNAYILCLHIASITFDKETKEYKCFIRNISEKAFVVPNGDKVELLRVIKLHLAQFYVDTLCNVKDEFDIPRTLLERKDPPSITTSVSNHGIKHITETPPEVIQVPEPNPYLIKADSQTAEEVFGFEV